MLAAVLASCGGGAGPTGSTAATSTAAPVATAPAGVLPDLPRADVLVGGEPWLVVVADTPEARARGLMGVTDLGDLDGMLFEWEEDVGNGFWMKDTLIPLDIAFFDAGGDLVDRLSMVPCEADPCPVYRPSGPYRSALEVPSGGFEGVEPLTLER